MIEAEIVADAERLSLGRAMPLDLRSLLAEFNIELRIDRDPSVGKKGALEKDGARFIIVVRSIDNGGWLLGLQERFTVAHELGHYLVLRRSSFQPMANREYWRLEEICNDFAAALLVPERILDGELEAAAKESAGFGAAVRRLSAATKTPLETAARRALGWLEEPGMFAVVDLPEPGHGRPLVRWLASTLPDLAPRRRFGVAQNELLWGAIAAAEGLVVGQRTQAPVQDRLEAIVYRSSSRVAHICAVAR